MTNFSEGGDLDFYFFKAEKYKAIKLEHISSISLLGCKETHLGCQAAPSEANPEP